MTPYLSLSRAARLYRIHAGTLGAAIRRGELPAVRLGKRKLLLRPGAIERWIDEHAITPSEADADVSEDVATARARGMR